MSRRRPHKVYLAIGISLVILIAGGLLFYGRNGEVALPLSLKFTDLSPEFVVVGHVPALEAFVKGRAGALMKFKNSQLCHEVNLSLSKPGRLLVKILPETIKVPEGVSVLEVQPAFFTVTIERRTEKVVPVVPDLRNNPVLGYVVSSVTPSPSNIRLTGPASMLEKILAVRTTPIDLAGLAESARKSVALNLNDNPYVQPVDNNGLVEVAIEIKEKVIEKWLQVAVQATGTDYRYEIRPDQIELLLRGPENTIRRLVQSNGIEVCIDLEGLTPGRHIRYALIEPPLNTTVVKAKPELFAVKIFDS